MPSVFRFALVLLLTCCWNAFVAQHTPALEVSPVFARGTDVRLLTQTSDGGLVCEVSHHGKPNTRFVGLYPTLDVQGTILEIPKQQEGYALQWEGFYPVGDQVLAVVYTQDPLGTHWKYWTLTPSLSELGPLRPLVETTFTNPGFELAVASDGSGLCTWISAQAHTGEVHAFDASLSPVWNATVDLDPNRSAVDFFEFQHAHALWGVVADAGYQLQTCGPDGSHVYAVEAPGHSVSEVRVILGGAQLRGAGLLRHGRRTSGTCSFDMRLGQTAPVSLSVHPFTEVGLVQNDRFLPAKKEQVDGLSGALTLEQLVALPDGGLLLMAEVNSSFSRTESTTQTSSGTQVGVSVTTTSTKTNYFVESILLVRFDADLRPVWSTEVHKRQRDPHTSGFAFGLGEKAVFLYYLDNASNVEYVDFKDLSQATMPAKMGLQCAAVDLSTGACTKSELLGLTDQEQLGVKRFYATLRVSEAHHQGPKTVIYAGVPMKKPKGEHSGLHRHGVGHRLLTLTAR